MRITKEDIIERVEHRELIKHFISYALNQLGEMKLKEISNKVHTSGKVQRFISEARKIGVKPGTDDFVGCIHSSTSFVLSKSETIAVASIILLAKWENEVDTPLGIADNSYLNGRFFSILERCRKFKVDLSSTLNFFERYQKTVLAAWEFPSSESRLSKSSIELDGKMCEAIRNKMKVEHRVKENMELVNAFPDLWQLQKIDIDKGAIFYSESITETMIVPFPFPITENIQVVQKDDNYIMGPLLKIEWINVQRIRDVEDWDVKNEGYDIYKEEHDDLMDYDLDIDPALSLFLEHWSAKYGRGSYARNEWIWVFGIEEVA